MSDYIWANPERLKYNSNGYGELALELGFVIDAAEGQTDPLEGEDVWGDDEAGQTFATAYLPSSLVFNLGIKNIRDGIQYTADGVNLMANTFEDGENNNYERASVLNGIILNGGEGGGGGGGGGGGNGEQQNGERKLFKRSVRPEGEGEPTRLRRAMAIQKPVVVKAVALVDQNGEPWPPNAEDRPRRLLSMEEMTALGMEPPTGAFRPVETTLTEEEIQQLTQSGAKPLAPNPDEAPVTFIGPARPEGETPLKARRAVRGELLPPAEPFNAGRGRTLLAGEPLLPLAPLEGQSVPGEPLEPFSYEPVIVGVPALALERVEEGEVVPGEPPLLSRVRHQGELLEPARFEPVKPFAPPIPPEPRQ